MRFVLVALVVLAPMGLGGCASVTRGWSEQMQIEFAARGRGGPHIAQSAMRHAVYLDGAAQGRVQRHVRQAGLSAADDPGDDARCRRSAPRALPVTILLGGVVGMGVDAASGATLEHYPNPVLAVLQPAAAPGRPPQPGERRRRDAPAVSQRPSAPPAATPVSLRAAGRAGADERSRPHDADAELAANAALHVATFAAGHVDACDGGLARASIARAKSRHSHHETPLLSRPVNGR